VDVRLCSRRASDAPSERCCGSQNLEQDLSQLLGCSLGSRAEVVGW
jgi:hypothetical protein